MEPNDEVTFTDADLDMNGEELVEDEPYFDWEQSFYE